MSQNEPATAAMKLLIAQLQRKRVTCGKELADLEEKLAKEFVKLKIRQGEDPAKAAEEADKFIKKISEGQSTNKLREEFLVAKTSKKTGETEFIVKGPSAFSVFKKKVGATFHRNKITNFNSVKAILSKAERISNNGTNKYKRHALLKEAAELIKKGKMTNSEREQLKKKHAELGGKTINNSTKKPGFFSGIVKKWGKLQNSLGVPYSNGTTPAQRKAAATKKANTKAAAAPSSPKSRLNLPLNGATNRGSPNGKYAKAAAAAAKQTNNAKKSAAATKIQAFVRGVGTRRNIKSKGFKDSQLSFLFRELNDPKKTKNDKKELIEGFIEGFINERNNKQIFMTESNKKDAFQKIKQKAEELGIPLNSNNSGSVPSGSNSGSNNNNSGSESSGSNSGSNNNNSGSVTPRGPVNNKKPPQEESKFDKIISTIDQLENILNWILNETNNSKYKGHITVIRNQIRSIYNRLNTDKNDFSPDQKTKIREKIGICNEIINNINQKKTDKLPNIQIPDDF